MIRRLLITSACAGLLLAGPAAMSASAENAAKPTTANKPSCLIPLPVISDICAALGFGPSTTPVVPVEPVAPVYPVQPNPYNPY